MPKSKIRKPKTGADARRKPRAAGGRPRRVTTPNQSRLPSGVDRTGSAVRHGRPMIFPGRQGGR